MYREILKGWLMIDNRDSSVKRTDNFNIYYKDVDSSCIDMIGRVAEKSLALVQKDFNYGVAKKINIIVYTDYEEMAHKIGLGSTGSTAMGVYYGGIISILEPSKWIKDKKNIGEVFEKQGPMVHELTHYILDYMTCGNIPVWFTEGMALFEENRVHGTEWAPGRLYESYYSPDELESNFYKLDEVKAYRQSFLVVRHIVQNYGMEAIIDIISGLKSGKSMNQASKSALGMSVEEIFKESLGILRFVKIGHGKSLESPGSGSQGFFGVPYQINFSG